MNKLSVSIMLAVISIAFSFACQAEEDNSQRDDGSRRTNGGATIVGSVPMGLKGIEKFPCGKDNMVSSIQQNGKNQGQDFDFVIVACFKKSDIQHKSYKRANGMVVTRSGEVITHGASKYPDFQQAVFDFDKVYGEQWSYIVDERTNAYGDLYMKLMVPKNGKAKMIWHNPETVKKLQKYLDSQSEE